MLTYRIVECFDCGDKFEALAVQVGGEDAEEGREQRRLLQRAWEDAIMMVIQRHIPIRENLHDSFRSILEEARGGRVLCEEQRDRVVVSVHDSARGIEDGLVTTLADHEPFEALYQIDMTPTRIINKQTMQVPQRGMKSPWSFAATTLS